LKTGKKYKKNLHIHRERQRERERQNTMDIWISIYLSARINHTQRTALREEKENVLRTSSMLYTHSIS
jgi:hypothetical protein